MNKKLWLVRDQKGRIFGPYNIEEICYHIEEEEFRGEEFISSYPSGKWKPLSSNSVFYEKILAKLSKKERTDVEFLNSQVEKEDNLNEESRESTVIIKSKHPESSSSYKKKKIKIKLSEEFKEDILAEEEQSDIIEMENIEKNYLETLKKSLKIPIAGFVVLAVLAVVLLNKPDKVKMNDQIRLLSVSKSRPALKKKELGKKLHKSLSFYFKSTVSHNLKSQIQYVKILESNPDDAILYQYLCLVYLELWPFAYQDTQDKKALNKTLDIVSKKNLGGIYSGLCKSVKALIDNNSEKSLMITNSSLNVIQERSPGFFYYLKAIAFKNLGKYLEARTHLQSIYNLQPKWVSPYMLDAQMFYENRQYDLAAKRYQKVLSIFPEHPSARMRLGILEYKYFKKFKKSEISLKSVVLNLSELVESDILIEAYITLAKIYLKQNNKKLVLEYTNKAHALDPKHLDVIFLISQLGERVNFKKTKIQARQLIYKGDMLVNQGKCSEAQTYFKKAYTADQKRNAMAALRMAKCYSQSGAYGQAIRWLKRAINADSNMLEAYFLLSDYLSELYDFESAKEILKAVKSRNPSNYDLFKAYALLFFRQKNYKVAAIYAEKSLKFYTSDVEIYILLSKAYRALAQGHKAFYYAEKAMEEDVNNISAEISYALALSSAEGSHKAIAYFEKLINHFPLIIEYSQALGVYYFDRGMYDEALAVFKNIIERQAQFKPAYIYLGQIYNYLSYKQGGNQKKYQMALRYFLEAKLLDTSDPDPIFYTAQTHMQHKQYLLAIYEFEKILSINRNYPLIHYYLGHVNFLQGSEENLEKALKFAQTQAEKTPKSYLPYKLAGDIYKQNSFGVFESSHQRHVNYEFCAREYQKALKYKKNDIEISISLIECYKGSGDFDLALQLALQVTKEEGLSGYPEIYRDIGSIYEAKEDFIKAWSYYSDYFSLNPGAKDRTTIEARIKKLLKQKSDLSQPE